MKPAAQSAEKKAERGWMGKGAFGPIKYTDKKYGAGFSPAPALNGLSCYHDRLFAIMNNSSGGNIEAKANTTDKSIPSCDKILFIVVNKKYFIL